MSERKIANRYALALMQQANAEGQLEAVAQSMNLIHSTCANSVDLRNALNNPIINPKQKETALLAIFKEVHPLVYEFVRMVCGKNRESLLQEIADVFLELYRKHNGIEKVSVQTATALSDSEKNSIQQYVQKVTGARAVELHSTIDPSIMGGMVIKFGDNLLDTSIAAKLRKLKKELNIA